MCLAVPAKILSIHNTYAYAETMGIRQKVNIQLIDDLLPGEYVLIHAGFAIEKIDESQNVFLNDMLYEMIKDDKQNG